MSGDKSVDKEEDAESDKYHWQSYSTESDHGLECGCFSLTLSLFILCTRHLCMPDLAVQILGQQFAKIGFLSESNGRPGPTF
jgi:hypothetical protein